MTDANIKEKGQDSILLIFGIMMLATSLFFVMKIINIDTDLIWEIPLGLSILALIVLYILDDFINFMKAWVSFSFCIYVSSIVLLTIFLIIVTYDLPNGIAGAIYLFLSIFYLALIYDIISFIQEQNKVDINSKIYNKIISNSELSISDFTQMISKETNTAKRSVTYKLFMLFGLPFILLGKGAAYFLTLGAGEYLNSKEYIVATLGFIFMSFLLMAFSPLFIAILRFRYPKDNEQN